MVSYKALNTIIKASCGNDIDGIGYGDCFKINTTLKSILFYLFYARWYHNAFYVAAIFKSITFYSFNSFGNFD